MPDVISRYRPAYRTDEIDLVLGMAKRGESLGFIGIAGVGKSNIVNYLRDIHQDTSHADQDFERLNFPLVDTTQWQGTPDSLWRIMLDSLNKAIDRLPPPPENSKLIPFSEDERAFKSLQHHINWVCQKLKQQIMFVLDDFDRVFEVGPFSMLEQLNVLRSEGNRGFLSYLVITKRLPHILGQNLPLENRSKFYDLFRHDIYTLEPYNHADTIRMLQHLNQRAGSKLSESQLEQISHLSGGHAGLTRLVFNIWFQQEVTGIKVSFFAEQPDIKQECWRVLENLHPEEQEVALRIAQGAAAIEDQAIINHLMQRGLILKSKPVTWFSPLMGHFLSTYGKQGG